MKERILALTLVALFARPATGASVAISAQPRIYTPTIIDGTGVQDVTSELNRFLAAVPDGGSIVFPAGAKYRVEGTLLLVGRRKLTIDGSGALVFATTDGAGVSPPQRLKKQWPRGRRHWLFVGGGGISIRNLDVRGANQRAGTAPEAYRAALEAQHGFEFQGVVGVELDSVRVTDVYGDFVYLGADNATKRWSDSIVVRNSHFERNGRQGIAITGARHVLIERNYIGNVRRSSLDFEPFSATGGAADVIVRENTFGPGRLLFVASKGKGQRISNITIERNQLLGRPMNIVMQSPSGTRRGPIRIIDNTSDDTHGSPLALMRFARVDGLEVRGNKNPLAAARAMTGISVVESCEVVVSGNNFPGAVREAQIAPFTCAR